MSQNKVRSTLARTIGLLVGTKSLGAHQIIFGDTKKFGARQLRVIILQAPNHLVRAN